MAKEGEIQLLYTLTPDKAPDPGSLLPGEPALELASDPVKLWVGVPASVDPAEQLPIGISEPATDGAYLRVKEGSSYSWKNRILSYYDWWDAEPILHFILQGEAFAPTLAISAFSNPGVRHVPAATFLSHATDANPSWQFSERLEGVALLAFARGSGTGLYVDYIGNRSGIYIANAGDGSRGIDVVRLASAGPSIRLTHNGESGIIVSPPEYLLGDIVFAGIIRETNGPSFIERGNGGAIRAVSTEQWSVTARGTRLEFFTTPNTTATPQRALVVNADGTTDSRGGYLVNGLPLAVVPTGGTAGEVLTRVGASFGWAPAAAGGLPSGGSEYQVLTRIGAGSGWAGAGERPEDSVGAGPGALNVASTGWGNVAIGVDVLPSNTSGDTNTAVGAEAMGSNTTGSSNTAIGESALASNVSGVRNVAIGNSALSTVVAGSYNTAVGLNALGALVNMDNNTAVGSTAGQFSFAGAHASGSASVYLGANTRPADDGQTNQIVIGYDAVGYGSNTITLGNDQITGTYLKGTVYINGVSLPQTLADLEARVAALE